MCDIEFTIEQGRLFILQTRVGKRTAAAALRMAVEMEGEGLIDQREAVLRVQPAQLDQLLHPQFDPTAKYDVRREGPERVARCGGRQGVLHGRRRRGAPRGRRAGDPRATRDLARRPARHDRGRGHPHVARRSGEPRRGRRPGHGHARGLRGLPRSTSTSRAREFRVGDTLVREGDVISINGTTGEVVVGEVAVITPEPTGPFDTILGWADTMRTLKVRTNADLPDDAQVAREFGAEGIGLCRTEHMFLGDRLPLVQRFILAADEREEVAALAALEKLQRSDFVGILEAMDGLPVTVRLLDPPLHEFLPDIEELLVARRQGRARRRGPRPAPRGAPVAGGEPDARDPRRAARRPEARALQDAGQGAARSGDRARSSPAATRASRS